MWGYYSACIVNGRCVQGNTMGYDWNKGNGITTAKIQNTHKENILEVKSFHM